MFFPTPAEGDASKSTLQAMLTLSAALEDDVCPSSPTCLDKSLLHRSMNLVYEDGMEMECVCSVVSPWRCRQASLSWCPFHEAQLLCFQCVSLPLLVLPYPVSMYQDKESGWFEHSSPATCFQCIISFHQNHHNPTEWI